jgi:hypothetical protein
MLHRVIAQNILRTRLLAGTSSNCTAISLCHSAPCLNGGTCIDFGDHYNCSCPLGFSGKRDCRDLPSLTFYLCDIPSDFCNLFFRRQFRHCPIKCNVIRTHCQVMTHHRVLGLSVGYIKQQKKVSLLIA